MDLQQLRYFLAVADTGGFSAAAARANVSQPALSRQIKLLEDEFGVSLFERQARGARLTDAGVRLTARARELLREAGEFKADIAEAATAPSGNVVWAVPSSLHSLLTAPVAAAFVAQYPNVSLSVIEGTSRAMREALAEGRADVAVFSKAEPLEPLDVRPLLTEALCAIAPVEAKLRFDHPIELAELMNHPLILTAAPNSLRLLLDRAFRAVGETCRARVQVETSPLVMHLVRAGLGWSALPYCSIHELLQADLVSAAPIREITISWVVATSRERRVGRAARLLAQLCQERTRTIVTSGLWLTARMGE